MLGTVNNRIQIVFTEDGFTYGNCLLVNDDIRLLIDTGAGRALNEVHLESIDTIINSHHHYDHIRGNDLCSKAKILVHPLEQPSMQSPGMTTATNGWEELMGDTNTIDPRKIGIKPESLTRYWRVDGEIHDNQVFDCGNTKLVALHTPGHSPGHCCFYFPDEDFVFLGDICLTKVGPWYGEPQTNIDDFIKSIDRILDLHPKKLATGHINIMVSEKPESVLTEYRDRILKREQTILKHLQKSPCSIHQLAEQHLIYQRHNSPYVLFWEKSMLRNHLEHLRNLGLVEPIEDGRFIAV